jgi:hypothetical protein
MVGFYKKYSRFRKELDGWELPDILALQDAEIEFLFKFALESSGMIAQAKATMARPEDMSRARSQEYYRAKGYHEVDFNQDSYVDDLDPEKILLIKESYYGKAK